MITTVQVSSETSTMNAPASILRASPNSVPPAPAAVLIGSKPTLLTLPQSPMRFLIMDAPRQSNLYLYIKELRKHSVTDVVRVCEPTYLKGELVNAGIQLHEMPYSDGHSPPQDILDRWLNLVEERFFRKSEAAADVPSSNTIALHCVAGLGRAPVLVAIALIEFAKMDPVEAVGFIRRHRRGAINKKQLTWLESYKRTRKGNAGAEGCTCLIM